MAGCGDGAVERAGDRGGGWQVLLGELVTLRLAFASVAILGGIALVVLARSNKPGLQKTM